MSEWAKIAVEQAVMSLSAQGNSELADDLRRIAQVVELTAIDALRFSQSERLAQSLIRAESNENLINVLREMCDAFGLENATFHVVTEGPQNYYATKVITTYLQAWISEYVESNYAEIDPVMEACASRSDDFHWRDLEPLDTMAQVFMDTAKAAGVGRFGFSFLVAAESGDRFALSVTSNTSEAEFLRMIEKFGSDLSILARRFCAVFVNVATGGRQSIGELPPDFRRLLRAAATGATQDEIDAMEFSYGSAKTLEKSICSMFRTRTLTEAVVLAARIGWLESTPLERSEVFGLSTRKQTRLT